MWLLVTTATLLSHSATTCSLDLIQCKRKYHNYLLTTMKLFGILLHDVILNPRLCLFAPRADRNTRNCMILLSRCCPSRVCDSLLHVGAIRFRCFVLSLESTGTSRLRHVRNDCPIYMSGISLTRVKRTSQIFGLCLSFCFENSDICLLTSPRSPDLCVSEEPVHCNSDAQPSSTMLCKTFSRGRVHWNSAQPKNHARSKRVPQHHFVFRSLRVQITITHDGDGPFTRTNQTATRARRSHENHIIDPLHQHDRRFAVRPHSQTHWLCSFHPSPQWAWSCLPCLVSSHLTRTPKDLWTLPLNNSADLNSAVWSRRKSPSCDNHPLPDAMHNLRLGCTNSSKLLESQIDFSERRFCRNVFCVFRVSVHFWTLTSFVFVQKMLVTHKWWTRWISEECCIFASCEMNLILTSRCFHRTLKSQFDVKFCWVFAQRCQLWCLRQLLSERPVSAAPKTWPNRCSLVRCDVSADVEPLLCRRRLAVQSTRISPASRGPIRTGTRHKSWPDELESHSIKTRAPRSSVTQ